MGLDVQKKTDGSVNIIGEVATDQVAAWMIQAAQVASQFTLFTHHAKTFPLLVQSLRNSLLKTGVFSSEKIAEEQVVGVLNFDIHLVKDFKGRRYIERITECILVENDENTKYKYVNILEYHDGRYVLTNPISEKNRIEMKNNMDEQDAVEFEKFCKKNWK